MSAERWLDVWETAGRLGRGLREAEMLRVACGTPSREALAELPIGTRDRLLLDLRQALFGRHLDCVADCPACGERCEWSCSIESLLAPDPGGDSPAWQDWSGDGWQVRFRLVNGLDLAALADCADEATAVGLLLQRCVRQVSREGQPAAVDTLPAAVVEAVSAVMAEADPQAGRALEVRCPTCAQRWQADVDAGAFLWAELDVWAQRLLADVHHLAGHYGWSERQILALSPERRARYLAMVMG